LKGVGPQRADLLKKELNIFTFGDLLNHFPYRHVDKTKVNLIEEITSATDYFQVAGILSVIELVGHKHSKRLVGQLQTNPVSLNWYGLKESVGCKKI